MDTKIEHKLEASEIDEVVAVLRWRFSRLVRAGYGLEDAAVVAAHPEIDLHEAVSLVERGCRPETAIRILV
jgi:hypothetical protein